MSFITDGGSYAWRIENGANTFGSENLCGGTLTDALYDKLGIGNVIARELSLKMWNPTIDPTQPIVLKLVKTDANGNTETIGKGTYFIDTIGKSPYSEYTDIQAYDAILKTDIPFMVSGDYTATTDYAIADEIATRIGVSLEAVTAAYLSANAVTINEVPNIGDNGTTCRQMLSVIAMLHGGNWIINDDGDLQLILLNGVLDSVDIVYIGSDGLFYYDDLLNMPDSASFTTIDGNGDFQAVAKADITDSTEVVYLDRSGEFAVDEYGNIKDIHPDADTIVIGNEVSKFDVSPTETIKRVEVWASSTVSYRSPSGLTQAQWEAVGGVVLSCNMPVMASQELADALYAQYVTAFGTGYEYIPYHADGAFFDPEAPLATNLTIKNDTVVLSKRTLSVDVLAPCDLEANATLAAVSYYPYITPVEREIKRDVAQNSARITVNEGSIEGEVQRAEGEETSIRTLVRQTADEWNATLTDYINGTEEYMRFYDDNGTPTLELGESDSNFKAKLTTEELAFIGADNQKAAWISNTQLNINEAVITTDEKFVASGGNWVEQTVNNHFQIKWIAN